LMETKIRVQLSYFLKEDVQRNSWIIAYYGWYLSPRHSKQWHDARYWCFHTNIHTALTWQDQATNCDWNVVKWVWWVWITRMDMPHLSSFKGFHHVKFCFSGLNDPIKQTWCTIKV
jgi:hypothetical protein